ncbi:hypothetical protein P3T76_008213 [Phytophthora citrophthora]|uniref:Uncharacterized protein n=1 Tax=Phytophthora citrophthora TaxID=4793 RepID=A0AAD9LKL7_9STRA|nr:hypothetical protein P3T76_008213 [Phytophthora citrophthora]
MTKLAGYQWESGELFYRGDAMKSFGLLKMDEDGAEFLVLRKLHWFKVRQDDLVVIGSVVNQRVTPCTERPCSGITSFFDRDLGGSIGECESPRSQSIRAINKVTPSPTPLNILPP